MIIAPSALLLHGALLQQLLHGATRSNVMQSMQEAMHKQLRLCFADVPSCSHHRINHDTHVHGTPPDEAGSTTPHS